jgi:hypothetical protein
MVRAWASAAHPPTLAPRGTVLSWKIVMGARSVAPTRGIHLHVRLYRRDFEKLEEVTNDRTVAYRVSFDTTFKKGVVFDHRGWVFNRMRLDIEAIGGELELVVKLPQRLTIRLHHLDLGDALVAAGDACPGEARRKKRLLSAPACVPNVCQRNYRSPRKTAEIRRFWR